MKKQMSFSTKHLASWVALAIIAAAAAYILGWLLVRFPVEYTFAGILGMLVIFALLRSPQFAFLALAFALPFERIGSVDIAGSTVRVSQVVLLCLLAYLFFGVTRRIPNILPKSYPIAVPLIAYAIIAGFSLLYAPNLTRSVSVLAFILFTMTASFIVPAFLNTEEKQRTLVRVLLASMTVVTVFGLYQWVGDFIGLPTALTGLRELYTKEILGFPRIQSTALEPLYFANYLLLPLSMTTVLFIRKNTIVSLPVAFGLAALGFLNLALTVARGGYIAMSASLAVIITWYFLNRQLISWRVIATLAGLGIVGIVAVTQLQQFDGLTEKVASHVVNIFAGASYNERAYTIEQAKDAFWTHPLVGIGPGSFGPYIAPHPFTQPDTGWGIVNNVYLEVLTETGILGAFALFSSWIIVIIRSIYALTYGKGEETRLLLVATLAAFIGIIVQYNTFSVLFIVHVWFVIGLLIALQNIALQNAALPKDTQSV